MVSSSRRKTSLSRARVGPIHPIGPWRAIVAVLAAVWCAGLAHAAFGATAKAPKCHRRARFGLAVASKVAPGQLVDLDITISKRSYCFSKPSRCKLLLSAPDGVVVSTSSQSLAEEAIVNSDFSQHYAWSLANLSDSRDVYAGEKRVATVYSLPVSTDLCAPRAALPFTVSIIVTPRSASKESSGGSRGKKRQRTGKTCTRMFEVAVPGGSSEPVDHSIKQPCNLLGCKTCLEGSDSSICQLCQAGWHKTLEGTCECAEGFGTYVSTVFETSLSYPGFTGVQPADTCLYRIDNPTYTSPLRRAEDCSGASPRVIQQMFVDPPECQCRACPAGWTSLGGPPKVAFCYPKVLPRYFKMEIEFVTPNDYSRYDITNWTAAESVMDSFAQTMVASGVRRYGALVLQPLTGEPEQGSAFGVQPRETSIFATVYTFNGTEADLAALVSAAQSCRSLDTPSGCALCRWDLCGAFKSTAPSSVLYRSGVAPIPTSVFNSRPSQDPIDYPDTLVDPQRRRLTDTKSTISFISSIFGNGGKLSQLFKDKKLLELGGLGFGTAFMVGGFILSFFSSPSVDPNTELLKSINQTVTATYEAVLLIQDELYAVANSLVSLQNQITAMFNALNDAILKTQCTSSFGYVQSSLQRIQSLYLTYCGVNLLDDQVSVTAGTVTQAMQTYLLDLQAGGNYSTSPRMQQSKKIVNDWADAVTTTVNPLFNELQIFSSTLLGAGQPTTGPLATCASAIFSSWRLYAAQKSPVDDRQYYDLINSWVMTLINLQAQAMQMIQAANQYKATNSYIDAALKAGVPNAIARSLSPDFCYYAMRAGPNDPLSAASIYCSNNDKQTASIYNNLIRQLELMGTPLSTGGTSQGTRLLLGEDITTVKAAVVGNPNSANFIDQSLVDKPTTTDFLLAAGAAAFDPKCASPSLSKAQAAGCSVLGPHASCGTGCGLNPKQEQLWAEANGGLFGSYPTSLWFPAGAAVWQQLRGTLTNMIPAGATGAAADTMALLSDPSSAINKGTNAVPFNMTDRTYWISNGTATANMQQIMMGTYQVNLTSFLPTSVTSVVLGCPQTNIVLIDRFRSAYGPYLGQNTWKPPASDKPTPMPFQPNITFPSAQCFAASNPTTNNGPGTIGRGSGTSGVFCSYLDFPALYTQECSQDGAYLCSDRYRCSVSISSSLIKAFPEIFDKHRGVKASSTCTWNPFPVEAPYVEKSACAYKITSNKCVPVTSAQTSSPQGYCALVGMKSGEIMKNPMYDSRNCPMAATTLSDGKLTGFFESSSANTGCRNADDCNCISTNSGECAATPGSGPCTGTGSRNFNVQAFSSSNTGNAPGVWASRQATYQCAGGTQSSFSLTPNGVANCLDTQIGRPSGKYPGGDVTFYGTQDTTWCPVRPECLNSFTYPWFPKAVSPDQVNWLPNTFNVPASDLTMFRLPALAIGSRNCTPSPFVNSTARPTTPRSAYTSWAGIVPTQCGDDMTLGITNLIGPGYYTTPLGKGAEVDLHEYFDVQRTRYGMVCDYTLGSSPPVGLVVLNVTVIVTDGPVYASDDPLYSGNPSSPYWQVGLLSLPPGGQSSYCRNLDKCGLDRNLSQALNSSVARSYTRVVDCVVSGVNTLTGLPFTLKAAQPYVQETYSQQSRAWKPFHYPMPGNYTYSGPPTQSPTQAPTWNPTRAPTRTPTRAPTRRRPFFVAEDHEHVRRTGANPTGASPLPAP